MTKAIDASDKAAATVARLKSSKSNEWYTPPDHIILVYLTLGDIDLDPASSGVADNGSIGAAKIFTEADGDMSWRVDGHRWKGRVYCNPPYGRLAGRFVEKALHEYEIGNMTAGILCLNGYSFETNWFRAILQNKKLPICWVH